jgi:hypothetical protein
VLVCIFSLVFAQSQIEALRLLEQAREAHGGQVLANLKTYQEKSRLTSFQGGQVARELTIVSYVDFVSQRLRIEYYDGNTLVTFYQVGPKEAVAWSQTEGKDSLGADQAQEFRSGMLQNWYGLRLGGSERESARLEGTLSFGTATGRAVAVKTLGVKTTYLFNAQNQLIAERYGADRDLITIIYGDTRPVGGLKIPHKVELFSQGVLTAEAKVVEARINPTFTAQTFKAP